MEALPRIKVLYINHTAKLGGGEIALSLLVQQMCQLQVESTVLLFEDGPLLKRLPTNVKRFIIPLSTDILHARKDELQSAAFTNVVRILTLPWFILRMARFIRDGHFDIVHTNSLKADVLGGLAARCAGAPLIWHIRDRIADDYLPSRFAKLFRLLIRIVPKGVIVNSRATDNTCNLPSDLGEIPLSTVIHDGVDLSEPLLPQGAVTQNTIGLIGRISPWKGQDVFIRAASIVHQQFPLTRFSIIGSALFGEEAYEQELHALTKELGLASSVDFLGFVSDVRVRLLDLLFVVHASTIGEPFGQVVIEAMATEKAVIATNGGGIPEIVNDSDTGILVPMSDHHALADAMLVLLNDPRRCQEMGQRGYTRVRNHFDIGLTAHKVLLFYKDVLNTVRY